MYKAENRSFKPKQRTKLSCTAESYEFLRAMRDYKQEHFVFIALDSQCCVIKAVETAIGATTFVAVDMGVVFRLLLPLAPSRVIFAHNHPGGSLARSEDDRILTEKLEEACKLFNIDMLDHLVIAQEGWHSLVSDERGDHGNDARGADEAAGYEDVEHEQGQDQEGRTGHGGQGGQGARGRQARTSRSSARKR